MISPSLLRNLVFGVEDSLVSTVGLLSGVAAAGTAAGTIILTGVVLIFVEAFSMGVGSVLSDNTTKEYREHVEIPLDRSLTPGLVMFSSYFISGFIPLTPYLLWSVQVALPWSIIFSLLALFVLGVSSARLAGVPLLHQGAKTVILGGLAIALGVLVGRLVGV